MTKLLVSRCGAVAVALNLLAGCGHPGKTTSLRSSYSARQPDGKLELFEKSGYVMIPGWDSSGSDIGNAGSLADAFLKCDADSTCQALNVAGWYKYNLAPGNQWDQGLGYGTYVKESVFAERADLQELLNSTKLAAASDATAANTTASASPAAGSSLPAISGWVAIAGWDSGGGDIGNGGSFANAMNLCADPACQGVNVGAWYKHTLLPADQWGQCSGCGTYVKEAVFASRKDLQSLVNGTPTVVAPLQEVTASPSNASPLAVIPGWVAIPGWDSGGGDIGNGGSLKDAIRLCADPVCQGVNLRGWYKSTLLPANQWLQCSGCGTYVKEAAFASRPDLKALVTAITGGAALPGYTYLRSVEWDGSFAQADVNAPRTLEDFAAQCGGYGDQCVAFTTTGLFKDTVPEKSMWKTSTDISSGIYIKSSVLEKLYPVTEETEEDRAEREKRFAAAARWHNAGARVFQELPSAWHKRILTSLGLGLDVPARIPGDDSALQELTSSLRRSLGTFTDANGLRRSLPDTYCGLARTYKPDSVDPYMCSKDGMAWNYYQVWIDEKAKGNFEGCEGGEYKPRNFSGASISEIISSGIRQGDMILYAAAQTRANVVRLGKFIWPDALIPYRFRAGTLSFIRNEFKWAAQEWSKVTRLRFIEHNSAADVIEVFSDDSCSFGGYSALGHVGGAQPLCLSLGCTSGCSKHEIGHAIGLAHEHQRADRNEYVQVFPTEAQDDKIFAFAPEAGDYVMPFGPFDYDSIMIYPSWAFSRRGNATLLRNDGGTIPYRNDITPGDIAAVNFLYDPNRPPESCVSTVTTELINYCDQPILAITRESNPSRCLWGGLYGFFSNSGGAGANLQTKVCAQKPSAFKASEISCQSIPQSFLEFCTAAEYGTRESSPTMCSYGWMQAYGSNYGNAIGQLRKLVCATTDQGLIAGFSASSINCRPAS